MSVYLFVNLAVVCRRKICLIRQGKNSDEEGVIEEETGRSGVESDTGEPTRKREELSAKN
jgi:hypothetical protein